MAKPKGQAMKRTKDTVSLIKDTKKPEPVGPTCPKCGAADGWTGPHYQKGQRVVVKLPHTPSAFRSQVFETTESLTYACKDCGYTRHEPCNDTIHKGVN